MLILYGCNHRSAPVGLRERLAFPEPGMREALAALVRRDAIEEGLIVSTCNRVEVLASGSGEPTAGPRSVQEFLLDQREVTVEDLERHAYLKTGRDVVDHLFRVASGLDSMILGEPQILGQVRTAYRLGKEHRSVGSMLERLMQHGFSTAKRVRHETGISRNPVSVAYAAVKLAQKIFGNMEGRSALILGAGKMAELVARHLQTHGVKMIVAGRRYTAAAEAAERCGGQPVHWEDGLSRLSTVDIVVSCTGATRPILGKVEFARALRKRKGSSLFVIDIAVPRDIDPSVNELDNVYLYDIDGLQSVVESGQEERRLAAEQAEQIVAREVEAFEQWRQSQEVSPMIVALRERLMAVGRHEVERHRRKLGALTAEQSAAIDDLARSLMQKVAHRPIRHLRDAVQAGRVDEAAALMRDLFGVEPLDVRPAGAERKPDDPTDRAESGPQRLVRGGKED